MSFSGAPESPRYIRRVIGCVLMLVSLGLFVVAGVLAVAFVSHAAPTATAHQQAVTTPTPTHLYGPADLVVGQTAATHGWKITLRQVTTHARTSLIPFLAPADVILVLSITVTNTTSTDQSVDGLTNFRLRDAQYQEYAENGQGTCPNGLVPAGARVSGQCVYEVPASEHQFVLLFDPTLSGDVTAWDLSR